MLEAVSNEDTHLGSELHLMFVVGSKMRLTGTSENLKDVVVWRSKEQLLKWRDVIKDLCGQSGDEERGCDKSFIPITMSDE
jgi:hypothetical protein